jgi:pyridoxine/pyridoxamine 5'-phosphate oxidase
MNDKKKALDFIKQQQHMVLSYLGDGRPHSALVGFSETDDFEIIFGTSRGSRKVAKLSENNQVSLIIGLKQPISIQIDGVAEEIPANELAKYVSIHTTKHPSTKKYAALAEQAYYRVKPNWLQYTDQSQEPMEIFEVTF